MRTEKALVIGGGIAGPVVALALRKAGIDSVIYESRHASANRVGGALALAPNGLAALGIVGADHAVETRGQPIRTMVMADGGGRQIGEFPALPGLAPNWAMGRAELNEVLQKQALAERVHIEYGKKLVGVDEGATGITARFADGSSATGDVLIGADGIHSTVRRLIDPEAPAPKHIPLLNFGAVADSAVRAQADAMYFVFGERGFFGYWLQPDGRTAWFSNLPHAAPMTGAEARAVSANHWLAILRERYANDVPARNLLEHTSASELVALGSMEVMPVLPLWYRGRMVLVGDSAHAPSSSSGQGASLAVESAIELARCLRDISDLSMSFAAYERLRRDRVQRVAARAAKTNQSKALGPVAKMLLRLLMPVATRTFMSAEKTLGTEQRFRIDWNQAVSLVPK
jgi:2-polyprenyl-6-methoxyphenol hydroxylase-like FAD-dependent oxidoreductase